MSPDTDIEPEAVEELPVDEESAASSPVPEAPETLIAGPIPGEAAAPEPVADDEPDTHDDHEEPEHVHMGYPPDWEVVAGTLRAVEGGKTAVVELPGGSHGVIPCGAFERLPRIGTRIEFAIDPDHRDDKGRSTLQLAEEDEKVTWKKLDQGMTVDAMVTGMNVGGLELKIAGSKIRAFMPKSQIDLTDDPDPTRFLNHKLRCRIISLERRRRRVVLSHRAVLERAHRKRRLKEIHRGDEMAGRVRKLEPFGVFVDLEPGLDGMVRIGDLSWQHVSDPAEVVSVGDEVRVRVLKIERGRLVLGIRQTQPNPWDAVAQKHPVGSKAKGRVVRTADFGAFVELEPGVEGMIHISQLSERRVESVEQAVRIGQFVEFKVLDVDARKQRLSLSIRALSQPEITGRSPEASREEIRRYVKSADKAKAVESLMARFGEGPGLKGGIG